MVGKGKWAQIAYPRPGPQPHRPYDLAHLKNNTIITVLIAALREERCPETVLSAFRAAAHPKRVRLGLVQQNAPGDTDCIAEACRRLGVPLQDLGMGRFANPSHCALFGRARVLRMNASEAAGPVYARAQQRQLVRDEDDFCLQIDAHTEFGRHWDMRMLAEWGAAANEYAILTAYPPNAMQLGKNVNGHWEMPHFCRARVVSPGIVRNEQASAAAGLTRPLMTALWGAGLSFSRCHAERRVPADPHLRHVFDGEEYSRGARLWTSGYDFYSPTRPIIGTYYGTDKGGKGGWRSVHAEWRASQARLSTLLLGRGSSQSPSARASLGEYALGTRRALSSGVRQPCYELPEPLGTAIGARSSSMRPFRASTCRPASLGAAASSTMSRGMTPTSPRRHRGRGRGAGLHAGRGRPRRER